MALWKEDQKHIFFSSSPHDESIHFSFRAWKMLCKASLPYEFLQAAFVNWKSTLRLLTLFKISFFKTICLLFPFFFTLKCLESQLGAFWMLSDNAATGDSVERTFYFSFKQTFFPSSADWLFRNEIFRVLKSPINFGSSKCNYILGAFYASFSCLF